MAACWLPRPARNAAASGSHWFSWLCQPLCHQRCFFSVGRSAGWLRPAGGAQIRTLLSQIAAHMIPTALNTAFASAPLSGVAQTSETSRDCFVSVLSLFGLLFWGMPAVRRLLQAPSGCRVEGRALPDAKCAGAQHATCAKYLSGQRV